MCGQIRRQFPPGDDQKNATGCVAAVSTVTPNFLLPAAADA